MSLRTVGSGAIPDRTSAWRSEGAGALDHVEHGGSLSPKPSDPALERGAGGGAPTRSAPGSAPAASSARHGRAAPPEERKRSTFAGSPPSRRARRGRRSSGTSSPEAGRTGAPSAARTGPRRASRWSGRRGTPTAAARAQEAPCRERVRQDLRGDHPLLKQDLRAGRSRRSDDLTGDPRTIRRVCSAPVGSSRMSAPVSR